MAIAGSQRQRLVPLVILLPVTAALLFPLFWIISISLKGDTEQFVAPPTLIPNEIVFSNYRRLLTETNFPLYIFNSLFVAVMTVVVARRRLPCGLRDGALPDALAPRVHLAGPARLYVSADPAGHSAVRPVHQGGPLRQLPRSDPRACDLRAAVRDVDNARLLSGRAGRDRGSRVRRRMRAHAAPVERRPCRSRVRGSSPPASSASSCRGATTSTA